MNVSFLQTSNDSRRGFVGRLLDPKLPVERRHFDCNRVGLSHKPVKHLSDKPRRVPLREHSRETSL